jgi:cardiolipin synthase (CMP-forming)
VVETGDRPTTARPSSFFNLPNLFTFARLLLAPVIAADVMHDHFGRAIVLLFAAGFTDVIDGYLARSTKSATPAGAYFDPIADKILLSVIYVALGFAGAMRWWMVAVVFGRDVLILAMAGYGLLFTDLRKFPPSIWGKISTFFQIAAALVVMGARAGIPAPVTLALVLMVSATIVSGVHYVWRAIGMLRQTAH